MCELYSSIEKVKKFCKERDWEKFHNLKDLSLALSIESAELNEIFLWRSESSLSKAELKHVDEELADILMYAILIAEKRGVSIPEIINRKLKKNGKKYPVNKSRGKYKKYTEL